MTALVGKLAPYFGVFLLMMVVGAITIHGVYEVPFRGDSLLTGRRRLPAGGGLSLRRARSCNCSPATSPSASA